MKNQLGITMVELVIVIVIILIIATFAVTSGRKTMDQADASEVYFEMNAIKEAVNSINAKRNFDENFALAHGEHYDAEFIPAPDVTYDSYVTLYPDDWYIILGKDDGEPYASSEVRDWLGLDSINHTYIVNFETGKVELYRPVKILNKTVRTYEEVRTLLENM